MDITIRPFRQDDCRAVLAIEAASFTRDRWTPAIFNDVTSVQSVGGMIAEVGNIGPFKFNDRQVAGYLFFNILARGKIDLIRFAVAPSLRRHGIFRAMMDEMRRVYFDLDGFRSCHAMIDEADYPSTKTLARLGWKARLVCCPGSQDMYQFTLRNERKAKVAIVE